MGSEMCIRDSINLTQNVHSGFPPNALPSSTQPYYSFTPCTAEYFRCIVLSAGCTELRLMAPSIVAASYFAISCPVDQFQPHFLHRILFFSTKADPQFLLAFFVIAGLIMRRASEASLFFLGFPRNKKPLHNGSYEHRVPKIKNQTLFCTRDVCV